MSVTFRLNKGKAIKDVSKPMSIYLRYSYGRRVDFNVSLKLRVLEDDWDVSKQRVKNRSHIDNKDEINAFLGSIEVYFDKEVLKLKAEGREITYLNIKRLYESFLKVNEEDVNDSSNMTLTRFIDKFIRDSEVRTSIRTGMPISKGTIKTYRTFRKNFLSYNAEKQKIDFKDVDLDFYYDYISWSESKNLSLNYIGKNIKTLKSIMSSAVEQGFTNNLAFKSRRFQVLKEDSDSIYLSLEELDKIVQLDLSKKPKLERARDLFIIGAFTGLRVSDYNYLTEDNLKLVEGRKMIVIEPKKTKSKLSKKKLYIPVNQYVDNILLKYDNRPPRKMPEQHINQAMKAIGKLAGIEEKVKVMITKGGMEVVSNKPKYELIQTHTARRSFCTNAYHAKMDMIDIMAISGHTTEKSFLKYIKVTPQERALKLSSHEFFSSMKAV